jgi:hypothetical protein
MTKQAPVSVLFECAGYYWGGRSGTSNCAVCTRSGRNPISKVLHTRFMPDRPSTSQEGQLVLFCLIDSHQDWNVQTLLEYIVSRLESIKMDKFSFPCVLSVPNLSKQRSNFNEAAYRQRMRLACSRLGKKFGCEKGVNLFEFFYPCPCEPIIPLPPQDPRRDGKRKLDAIQKKARRWKAKCEIIKRRYIKLSKELTSASKKAEKSRLSIATELKSVKKQSRRRSLISASKNQAIQVMRKALKECVKFVGKKQKEQLKKLKQTLGDNFDNDFFGDEDSEDDDEDEKARDGKLRQILMIQKHNKVSREAVREFCKTFDDDDVNAGRLEKKWTQCRKDVVDLYKLNVASNTAVDKNGAERVFVYVADLDNYLTQIINLEGLPSTASGDADEPALWLRVGGDGRSIHRNSNNILIIIALMDTADPRRSHSPLFVHTLMLIDGDESHDLLVDALIVIDEWIQKSKNDGFTYEDKLYKVNVVLTGDMKFIQLVKGLQGATSVFSCPLCFKPKQAKMPSRGSRPSGGFRCACDTLDGSDPCDHWSGAGKYRTNALAEQLAETGGDCWSHMGHHKTAPLKSIDWTMVVLDTLHGLLRITDVIFGSLYEWARRSYDPSDKKGLLAVSDGQAQSNRYFNGVEF